jgi:ATP-binding cassette subfamily B protein
MEKQNDIASASGPKASEAVYTRPIGLLWPMLYPHAGALAGGVLAMVVSAAAMLAIGWGLKEIVDMGLADASGAFLDKSLLIIFGVIVVMSAASYTRLKLVYRVAERVTADLRARIFRHLLSLDPAFFEKNKTGDQISRINTDTTVLQIVITSNLPSAFRHFLMLIGGLAMLCIVSPGMTGILMLSVPLILGPIIYFGRKVRGRSRDSQARVGDISAYGMETLQGIQTIQSFGYEEAAARHFGGLAEDAFSAAQKYIGARAFLTALVIALVLGAIGVVLWYGGHKVLTGDMTSGDLSAFIFYAATVAGAVMAISEAMTEFSRAAGAADRISQLLATTPSHHQGKGALPKPSGAISFKDICFSYPLRPEARALDSVSFEIAGGQVAALVGPSGAGKTTIFQLLQRFYDPTSGAISIDGHDILNVDPRDLRRHLGVVSQDPAVFSISVAENIRIGRAEASDEDVRRAAELAQAHEFISALPQGYDTLVGERGSRLSGGQRQRIAIARAILKNPKILLLDEATSALDSANEQAVHLALKSLMKGRTTLIIAHRLSTVQNADKIIVLDKGRVVAEGTHAALYGSDSLYTHLAGLQLDVKAG